MAQSHLTGSPTVVAVVLLAALPASAYTPTHTFGPSPTPTATGTAPPPQAVLTVTPNPARSGQRVLLDGSATLRTRDFRWRQLDGDVAVEIEGADQPIASFIVPPLDSPVQVTIELVWSTEPRRDLSIGSFHFDAVPPGDYTLTVSPSCNPFGCWAPLSIHVADADVSVTICPDAATATPSATSTPTDGAGATVTQTPALTPTATDRAEPTVTPTPTVTETAIPTPTNPPGSCCGESCGGLSFTECQAAAETGDCEGWSDPCLDCVEISGSVSFGGLEIDPPEPSVGDEVILRFEVTPRVYSVEGVNLNGASPFLAEVRGTSETGTTFQATATVAGRVSVTLQVAYRTEEACTDPFGNTYYSPGPLRSVTSPPYEFEIADAPTSQENGGDGCQLVRGGGDTLAWLPWLLAVAVIASRRRLASADSRETDFSTVER